MTETEIVLFLFGQMVFGICMGVACIMDWREQRVYRFVWLIASAAAVLLIILRGRRVGVAWGSFIDLALFTLMQQLWFSRFYGRADCHAFCVCAAVMLSVGLGPKAWLIHMLLVFSVLSVVQVLRRNVGPRGKLLRPVPLIPYITFAFCLWVDFAGGKWYI